MDYIIVLFLLLKGNLNKVQIYEKKIFILKKKIYI